MQKIISERIKELTAMIAEQENKVKELAQALEAAKTDLFGMYGGMTELKGLLQKTEETGE